MLTVIPCIKTLGRVDEFEVLTTKSMTCGKIGFATNSSKINGLVLIRQHALVLHIRPDWIVERVLRLANPYRKRKEGAGRKYALPELEDQLLLTLVWCRYYLVYI